MDQAGNETPTAIVYLIRTVTVIFVITLLQSCRSVQSIYTYL